MKSQIFTIFVLKPSSCINMNRGKKTHLAIIKKENKKYPHFLIVMCHNVSIETSKINYFRRIIIYFNGVFGWGCPRRRL